MIKKRFLPLLAGFAFMALATTVNARPIICESHGGRPQHCPADTKWGVQLVQQLSHAPCMEGRTWGYDRRGIWVTGGCRAQFEVAGREYRRDHQGPPRPWERQQRYQQQQYNNYQQQQESYPQQQYNNYQQNYN